MVSFVVKKLKIRVLERSEKLIAMKTNIHILSNVNTTLHVEKSNKHQHW